MRLKIEHLNRFTYDQAISEAYTEIRLQPLSSGGQRCLAFSLTPEPRQEVRAYHDRYGNDVHHFDVLQPHQQLVVNAVSEVLTPETYQPEPGELSPLEAFDYLAASDYAPLVPEVAAFAAAHSTAPAVAEDPLGSALALMAAVNGALRYEKGVTDVHTTAPQALLLGGGVCQDYSHLMLAACRHLGLPARYVSGYLYNNGHTAASHAWVDVYVPGPGWLSLDPTHNRQQTAQYVRVAVGRDYADVAPTRGVFKGQAVEVLEVTVHLTAL
ncbi:MAG: transglutaminase family protein [Anaerolineales bacterium]